MKLYALDADVQTYCHHAHTQLHTPHCLLVVSGKKYSHLHPKGIALLAVADGFVFIFYSLCHTVSQHSPFSHRLLILIQRELSGLHNRIFSFFPLSFFFLLSTSHPAVPPTHISFHFALLSIKIVLLDKRGAKAFTDRGGEGLGGNQ